MKNKFLYQINRYQWFTLALIVFIVASAIPLIVDFAKDYKQQLRAAHRAYDLEMIKKLNPPQNLAPFQGNFAGVKMAISRAYLMPVPGAVVYEGDESIWSPDYKAVPLDKRSYADTFTHIALVMDTTNYEGSITGKNRFKERNPYDPGENKWLEVALYVANPINRPDVEQKYTQIYKTSREDRVFFELKRNFIQFLLDQHLDTSLDSCYKHAFFESEGVYRPGYESLKLEKSCKVLFEKLWQQYQGLYLAKHKKPAYMEQHRSDLGLMEYIPVNFRSIDSPPDIEYVHEENGLYKTLINCGNNLSGKTAKIPQSEMACTQHFIIPKYQAEVRVHYAYKFLPQWKTYQQGVTERLKSFEVN